MLLTFFNRATGNATLLLLLTTLFWAGNFIVGRGVHETIPPLALATLRWSIATTLFMPFAIGALKRDWPTIKEHFPIIALLGGLGVGCFNSFAYIGLNHTTALNGVIILSAAPIMIILMALALFGERFSLPKLAGVVISLAGVIVVVTRGSLENLAQLRFNEGDAWFVAAVMVWALYTVLLRKRPSISPVSFIAITFLIGTLLNVPFFLWEHFQVRQLQFTNQAILAIAYVSIFPSILSYLSWNKGVALIGASKAGTFLHFIPLFGSALAIIFLGEQLFFFHALGFALILIGVTIAVKS